MGTNTKIDHILDTNMSIKIQFHPYIQYLGWIDISGGVDEHISDIYVHIRLNPNYPTAPGKNALKYQHKK